MATTVRGPAYRDTPSPVYQDIIEADPKPAPAMFHEYAECDIPVASVARDEYCSAEFAAAEREHMWSRVWQMAGRVEQIPEAGDVLVYESPGASLLVVRTNSGEIRAYQNSCLHRGMKLCTHDTSVAKLTCPFHGFTWTLEGDLEKVPARWDFPGLKDSEMKLPEVAVGVWDGFIFINRSKNPVSLETYLGHLVPHFKDWSYADRYVAAVIRKPLEANWKAAIEAFLEAYHVSETHTQAMPFSGDTSTQYDVWADDPHVSRFLEPTGIVSDHYPRQLSEQEVLDAVMDMMFAGKERPSLSEGGKARHFLSSGVREEMGELNGVDYSELSDTEAGDAIQYSLFPNLVIFRSLPYPFVYRFLPNRVDPDRCTFEFFVFKPLPADGGPLPEMQIADLGENGTFAGSGVIPAFQGEIYDQDVVGLRQLQQGMRDGGTRELMFSRYQEVRIRHLHQTLHRYLNSELGHA